MISGIVYRELYKIPSTHAAKGIGNSIKDSVFICKRYKILFTVLISTSMQRTLNRNSVLMGNQSGRIDHSKEKIVAVLSRLSDI